MNINDQYYFYLRPEMIKFLPASYKTVLEIGCGEGRFSENLTTDTEKWGIEPVAKVAEIATSRGIKVLMGRYEDVYARLPDDYFDLIICNDVIEHMTDHDLFFSTIKTKLKNTGVIVGSIPNVRYIKMIYWYIIKKDWEYTDSFILDRTHLRFFTKKSLLRTFRQHEYDIEMFEGINPTLKYFLVFFLNVLKWISFGYFDDMRDSQFAFRVRKIQS